MNSFDKLGISIQEKWNGIDTQRFDDEKTEMFARLMENKCIALSQNEKISSLFFQKIILNEGKILYTLIHSYCKGSYF